MARNGSGNPGNGGGGGGFLGNRTYLESAEDRLNSMDFGNNGDEDSETSANGDEDSEASTNGESDDADTASSITNGQLEYVGKLSMTFDDAGLANSFDFGWKRLKQEDADASFKENWVNNIAYDTIINADYETGLTPFKVTSISGSVNTSTVIGWAHGNIQRPSFKSWSGAHDASDTKSYSVSYSADESEQLEEQYDKGDFTTNIENVIQSISENVHNRMNINMNQDLDFQKNKNKKIGFKKISIFEAQQEDTNISSTSTTSIVDSEMSGIYS